MRFIRASHRRARIAWACLASLLLSLLWLHVLRPATAQEPAAPTSRPDAAAGLETFAGRCATCHGPQGLGDGDQAAQLPGPPTALAGDEFLRQAIPAEMFAVITNGRVERAMPPFGPASSNPIDEAGRWDLVAAIYSLGTPAERVAQGQAIYEDNCLACHGANGAGDGPEAAGLAVALPDLADLAYWSQNSNQSVFERLSPGTIATHDFDLAGEGRWAVVDYLRTFGYAYQDALALLAPLPAGTITGQVVNGTMGETFTGALSARLEGYNADLELTVELFATVDSHGSYHFQVSDVPQDWFYRVAVSYKGLDFGSGFGELSAAQPAIELPVVVYESSADPAAITIDRVHLILDFAESVVQVNELYVFNNNGDTVFVGESGDSADGTARIALPTSATNPVFQRGFGSFESFFPAQEVIPTATGWADTLPLRPGEGSLVLLVSYTMPYQDRMTVAHPLYYGLGEASLILTEAGVSLLTDGGWAAGEQPTIEGGSFLSYRRAGLSDGDTFSFQLAGRPRATPGGTAGLVRDEGQELLIGGATLLATLGAIVYLARAWQRPPAESAPDRAALLRAIADLDETYDRGELSAAEYHGRRQSLKSELLSIWRN